MTKQILFLLLSTLLTPPLFAQDTKLKIQGSSTVNPIVAEAAEILEKQHGWQIIVDTQGGSTGGIHALGQGLVDIAMSSKPLSEKEKKLYPQTEFQVTPIGLDAIVLAISAPVWQSGIQSLSREEIQRIYGLQVTKWSQLGGPNSRIVFYNKEPGRGTWHVFAKWLYGDVKKAPLVSHPEVGGNEEAKNKVANHRGAITQLSLAWVEKDTRLFGLGIKDQGKTIEASEASIQSGGYPLARKLFTLTNQNSSPASAKFIDFLLSEEGQQLVRKHGFIPVHS